MSCWLPIATSLDFANTSDTDLVAEALLCGEVGAVGNHQLTGEDGVSYELNKRRHVRSYVKLQGHLTLSR